jgi:anti-sigma factor RsiW
MDCDVTRTDLIDFHFGEIDDQPRLRVEAHLLSCPACLREFMAIKRAVETTGTRPSEAARERLRAAVAREVAPLGRAAWSWWQRPLAVAVAAAAVVLAAATVNILAAGPGRAPHAWSKPDPTQQTTP